MVEERGPGGVTVDVAKARDSYLRTCLDFCTIWNFSIVLCILCKTVNEFSVQFVCTLSNPWKRKEKKGNGHDFGLLQLGRLTGISTSQFVHGHRLFLGENFQSKYTKPSPKLQPRHTHTHTHTHTHKQQSMDRCLTVCKSLDFVHKYSM